MKYIWCALIAVCIFFVGICHAEGDAAKQATGKTKTVLVDRNQNGKIDGEDVYDNSGKIIRSGYDTDEDGIIDKWEVYDPQTGFPKESSDSYDY